MNAIQPIEIFLQNPFPILNTPEPVPRIELKSLTVDEVVCHSAKQRKRNKCSRNPVDHGQKERFSKLIIEKEIGPYRWQNPDRDNGNPISNLRFLFLKRLCHSPIDAVESLSFVHVAGV